MIGGNILAIWYRLLNNIGRTRYSKNILTANKNESKRSGRVGILSGNPKDEPMHYGEIYDVWSASTMGKGAVSYFQVYLNHVGDKDLKMLINDYIEQAKQEIKDCDELLQANGITPAPTMPERPVVKLEDIPAGARFADQEIAASMAAGSSVSLVACTQTMSKCIREDVGAIFAKHIAAKTILGTKTLHLLKEKGWLIPPPLQIKRPETANA
jgi:hypothetical protein